MKLSNTATGTLEVPQGAASQVLRLEVGHGSKHRSYVVTDGLRLVVGTGRDCDVVVDDRTVSKKHCELGCDGRTLWVRDLGSKNGVYAGGARVERALLSEGSCFTVGRVAMCVRDQDREPEALESLPGVIGTSAPMMRVAARVKRMARLSVPVLLRGPTGSGKDVVARAIHALSSRRDEAFVDLNMGAIPASLAAAELFGHERGAFTGAGPGRKGAFVAADGGTLFLDEIAEASRDVQVHMLRALEQREVQPLGSDQRLPIDVRVVAATWTPLDQAVEQGRFRQDLFHRLAVVTIPLPPLADRKSDIAALTEHILERRRSDVGDKQISPSALGRLMAYHWPGNVRELANVITHAAVLCSGQWIRARHVDAALGRGRAGPGRVTPAVARAIVTQCRGNVAEAARRCGVPRSTFRGWLGIAPAKKRRS